MSYRVEIVVSDELYQRIVDAAGDVPKARWIRNVLSRELPGPGPVSGPRAGLVGTDQMRRDLAYAAGDVKQVVGHPKGCGCIKCLRARGQA